MRKLVLRELRLGYFKGATNFTLVADGDVDIYGDNGTGKTTIFDGVSWLFYDRDSLGAAKFGIKTTDPKTDKPIPQLDHEALAKFELDGQPITLGKVLREDWSKVRQVTETFVGHTTEYKVNGVPVREREYLQELTSKLADPVTLRLLSDPAYFPWTMAWKDRRTLLLRVCGGQDITDAEIIESDPKFAELPGILGQHSLEAWRKIATARSKELVTKKNAIPARIDEANRALPEDLPVVSADAARAELTRLQELSASVRAGGAVTAKKSELTEVESAMVMRRSQLQSEALDQDAAENHRKALEVLMGSNSKLAAMDSERSQILRDQAEVKRKLSDLIAKHTAVSERTWKGSETCPTCAQALPVEEVEKAQAAFNEQRARDLEVVMAAGKEERTKEKALADDLIALEHRYAEESKRNADFKRVADELGASVRREPDYDGDPELKRLAAEKERITGELNSLQTSVEGELAAIDSQIVGVRAEVQAAENSRLQSENRIKGLARIEELQKEERAIALELEQIDKGIYLSEEFIRAKVKLLEDRINAKFTLARFRLFEELIGGGLTECCEAMVDGVDYSDLNQAKKVNVGLDIINTLAEYFDFAPPVFIDGAESITRPLPTVGQQIRLIVSPDHPTLTVVQRGSLPPTPIGGLFEEPAPAPAGAPF